MKYSDINRRYTDIVAEYLQRGWRISTNTMNYESYACIDLTDGLEIHRVCLTESMCNFSGRGTVVYTLAVGKLPSLGYAASPRCMDMLLEEDYYLVSADGDWYGTEEEARTAAAKRAARIELRGKPVSHYEFGRESYKTAWKAVRRIAGKTVSLHDISSVYHNLRNGEYLVMTYKPGDPAWKRSTYSLTRREELIPF